ncbi:MAG: hypothetical protein ACLQVN_22765 [Bryobacteraceae bacterium]
MKILANGMFCVSLLWWGGGGGLQAAPQTVSSAPGSGPNQAEVDAGADAAADPSSAGEPQTPPQQQPAAQQPSGTPGGPIVQAAPELPKYPDVRLPGESGWWVGFTAWLPQQAPTFNKGEASNFTNLSKVTMAGTPKFAIGAEFGIAVGLHNFLRLSGFEVRSAGDFTAASDLTLWGSNYNSGWLMSSDYQLRDVKLSFEYLTWPYPVESRKVRVHTLYQIHYVTVRSGFDAPTQPLYDSAGNPLENSSGQAITFQASGTKWFVSPALGVGLSYYVTPRLRVEANGAGFLIPHHFAVADTDASVNYRILGQLELGVGGKFYDYKTTTKAAYFQTGYLGSVAVSLKWYSK